MDILDIIQNRNNQLYGVVNFIMLIYVFSNRAKDKFRIIFIKRPKESLTLLLILLEIIVLAIFYIAVIIGACMSDYD